MSSEVFPQSLSLSCHVRSVYWRRTYGKQNRKDRRSPSRVCTVYSAGLQRYVNPNQRDFTLLTTRFTYCARQGATSRTCKTWQVRPVTPTIASSSRALTLDVLF